MAPRTMTKPAGARNGRERLVTALHEIGRILDLPAGAANFRRVARVREAATPARSPEEHLQKAVAARSAATRAKYAKLGLSVRAPLDRTTQAMLLRQLYLAHFEARRFVKALEVAHQLIELQVLTDVAHQDAARAAHALGDIEQAAGHLRLAARTSPASRRAFHFWTLGGLLYLEGRYEASVSVLERSLRWGTTDKPLYAGHLALARLARGDRTASSEELIEQLEVAPCGQGYGRFVLGLLCRHFGRRRDAVRYLDAFVRRTEGGRLALRIALQGELDLAKRTLSELRGN
jgi:tetratricopeptide (TPR) repeat protein